MSSYLLIPSELPPCSTKGSCNSQSGLGYCSSKSMQVIISGLISTLFFSCSSSSSSTSLSQATNREYVVYLLGMWAFISQPFVLVSAQQSCFSVLSAMLGKMHDIRREAMWHMSVHENVIYVLQGLIKRKGVSWDLEGRLPREDGLASGWLEEK